MEIKINDDFLINTKEDWNELTLEEQLTCYAILMQETGNLLEAHEVLPTKRIFLLKELMKVGDEFFAAWMKDLIEEDPQDGLDVFHEQLKYLSDEVTGFFFDEQENEDEDAPKQFTMALGLTKCPYPQISRKLKLYQKEKNFQNLKKAKKEITFYGPGDGLENITIYELGTAFTLFENYLNAEREEKQKDVNKYVNQLIATLWREGKTDHKANRLAAFQGDRRLPLLNYEAAVDRRIKPISMLPKSVKQLILFWFASCRQKIINSYPLIFRLPEGGASSKNNYGWAGTLFALSKDFDKVDVVSQQNANTALLYLSYLEDQRKLQEIKK